MKNNKAIDVTALGELLIDFTENGLSPQGNPTFEANPGGAPCNVLAMLNRLGKKTAFIGKVGGDMFGRQLSEAVKESGTDISGLVTDDSVPTTLAFVHTLKGGDREFSFIRNPGADMMLREDEVNADIITQSEIFHFGTLSSTHEGVRRATRYAIDAAKESGALISFDPNLRERLWDDLDDAKREIEYGFSKCDILKISDNEVEFMTGMTDYDKAADMIRSKYGIKLMFVTLGKDGSRGYYGDITASVKGFPVNAIETTGAGDTFCGCALNYVLEHGIDALTKDNLTELLTFAGAAAAIVTTRKGALRVMPSREEILSKVKS
jgi:fructokinase